MPKIYTQVRTSKIQVGLVVIKIYSQAGKFQFSTIKNISFGRESMEKTMVLQ